MLQFFDVDDSTKSAINCHLEDFYNLLVAGKFVESVGPSQILQVLLLKLIDERTKRPNAI